MFHAYRLAFWGDSSFCHCMAPHSLKAVDLPVLLRTCQQEVSFRCLSHVNPEVIRSDFFSAGKDTRPETKVKILNIY